MGASRSRDHPLRRGSARRLHFIPDNAATPSSKKTKKALAEMGERMVLHFLRPYCPRATASSGSDGTCTPTSRATTSARECPLSWPRWMPAWQLATRSGLQVRCCAPVPLDAQHKAIRELRSVVQGLPYLVQNLSEMALMTACRGTMEASSPPRGNRVCGHFFATLSGTVGRTQMLAALSGGGLRSEGGNGNGKREHGGQAQQTLLHQVLFVNSRSATHLAPSASEKKRSSSRAKAPARASRVTQGSAVT